MKQQIKILYLLQQVSGTGLKELRDEVKISKNCSYQQFISPDLISVILLSDLILIYDSATETRIGRG